jgi:poly(A) polymerase
MRPDGAVEVIRKLRSRGHEAYLVGGCVRDLIMKIEPADYDIATSALPEDIIRIFPRTEPIGAQFGVILVIHRGHPYEVATFRSDEAYVDGRRPTGVVFTDARTDVLRRDFTINGLLYDPVAGEVIDHVSGQADIRAKVVRAIGDPQKRFEEDKLRILRAIRFGARLGYSIEPKTWAAVRRMAPEIRQVSAERIRDELLRILTEGQAAHGCRMLHESGVMAVILPDLRWDEHLERTLGMLQREIAPDFAMAVLLHETPEESVGVITDRMKFSGYEAQHIFELVDNRRRFRTVRKMPVSSLKRFFRMLRFEDHLELARICAAAGGADLEDYNYALLKYRTWSQDEISPAPLVSGEDLIELGFTPGPVFKEILTRVEDEQLEGRLQRRAQAVEFVLAHYKANAR